MKPIQGVIITSGRGTKMWPYSDVRPKCLLPVFNQTVLHRQILQLQQVGIQTLIIIADQRGMAAIRAEVERITHRLKFKLLIRYVMVESHDGSADALCYVIDDIMREPTLVLYGDIVTPVENIYQLIQSYEETREQALLVSAILNERSEDWLCAYVDDQKIVSRVIAHPRSDVNVRLSGAYVFDERIIPYLRATSDHMTCVQVGVMPPVEADLIETLHTFIGAGGTFVAYYAQTYCIDLDKPWHILEANARVMDEAASQLTHSVIPDSSYVSPEADIRGHIVLGEHVRIGPRVLIEGNAWIGDGSVVDNGAIVRGNVAIGRNVEIVDYCLITGPSAIGDRGVLRHGAEFSGVAFPGVYLYHYMELYGVIGEGSDLGAATVCGTLRFDDGETPQRIKGRREHAGYYAHAVYIGDHCRTGVNAILMPGCKIGTRSVIGAGIVLQEDVPSETLLYVEQVIVKKKWGTHPYGW